MVGGKRNGAEWTECYERRTYVGQAPNLSPVPDLKDRPQRKHWLTLFLLGACHTIGRTKPEQHKGFLQRANDTIGWTRSRIPTAAPGVDPGA